jgi:hypothetical protein
VRAWAPHSSCERGHGTILPPPPLQATSHMSLRISASKEEVRASYLPALRKPLVKPLEAQGPAGVEETIRLMDAYGLTKDDFDAILEMQVQTKEGTRLTKLYPALLKSFRKHTTELAIRELPVPPLHSSLQTQLPMARPIERKGGAHAPVQQDATGPPLPHTPFLPHPATTLPPSPQLITNGGPDGSAIPSNAKAALTRQYNKTHLDTLCPPPILSPLTPPYTARPPS